MSRLTCWLRSPVAPAQCVLAVSAMEMGS